MVVAFVALAFSAALAKRRRAASIERRSVRCPETGATATVRVLECSRTGRTIGLVECSRLTREGLPLCDLACLRPGRERGARSTS